jgi:hypothetical protein
MTSAIVARYTPMGRSPKALKSGHSIPNTPQVYLHIQQRFHKREVVQPNAGRQARLEAVAERSAAEQLS